MERFRNTKVLITGGLGSRRAGEPRRPHEEPLQDLEIDCHDLARKIVEIVGSGKINFTEFTRERQEVEPGDYYADISKIKRVIGWEPRTSLDEGIAKTADFYRTFKKEYWT